MTIEEIDAIKRQARVYVHPALIGGDADRAVVAILVWEIRNPDAAAGERERSWMRLAEEYAPALTA